MIVTMLEAAYFEFCYLGGARLLLSCKSGNPTRESKQEQRREQEGRRDGGTDRVREREGDI